jgi:hypothetical protein
MEGAKTTGIERKGGLGFKKSCWRRTIIPWPAAVKTAGEQVDIKIIQALTLNEGHDSIRVEL